MFVVVYKMRESAVLGGMAKCVGLVISCTLRRVPGFRALVFRSGGSA